MKADHERLIDELIKIRDDPRAEKKLREIVDYGLTMEMNGECIKCSQSKYNHGACSGKVGGNPCLVFKQTNIVRLK